MKIEIGHWYIVNIDRRILVYVRAYSDEMGMYKAYNYYLSKDGNVSNSPGMWTKGHFERNKDKIQHLGEYSIKEFIEAFPEYYGIYNIEDLDD
jgi:hypothetical protein